MKRLFTKIHLWLSIPFGVVIAIICFTGAILVFEDEILEAQYPERYFVKEVKKEALLPSKLVSEVQHTLGDTVRVTRIRMYGEADRNWKFYFDKGDTYFVDPYTGRLAGKDERCVFFSKTMRLHRFLLHSYRYGKDTPWGKWIVGCSTIAFAFILITGLVIWFPRNRKSLKNRLTIKTGAGKFRFWYDLHVTGGFYAAFFLLAMALTGLTWSFPWYRTAFYSLLGGAPTQSGKWIKPTVDETTDYLQWNKVCAEIQKRYPDYNTINIQHQSISVSATNYGNTGATDKFTFDAANGLITKEELYKDASNYTKLRGWVWAFHSGQWGGMTTRILSFLATILGGIFVFTGYYFWIRKKLQRRKHY